MDLFREEKIILHDNFIGDLRPILIYHKLVKLGLSSQLIFDKCYSDLHVDSKIKCLVDHANT